MSRKLIFTAALSAASISAIALSALAQPPAGAPAQGRGGGAGRGAAPAGPVQPVDHADYGNPANWLCLPDHQDACTVNLDTTVVAPSGATTIERFAPAKAPAIDCFYIYPTVSNDPFTTSDLIPGPEERAVIERQFARFGAVCRQFAPMYRQTTLTSLSAGQSRGAIPQPPARGAPGQANADIDDAFAYYMAHYNNGRGVVIIGHSQGAGQVSRLVRAQVDGKPLLGQLVSTLIIVGSVNVPKGKDVGGTFQSIPACHSKSQIGCVITYGSYRDNVPPNATGQAVGAGASASSEGPNQGLCVDPAVLVAGKPGKAPVNAYLAVNPSINPSLKPPPRWSQTQIIRTPFVRAPGLITSECVDKGGKIYREIHVNADPSDKRADDIYGDVMRDGEPDRGWGLHNLDMNLGMGDFITIVRAESEAYVKAHAPAAPKAGSKTKAKAKT